jgi:hypothetical protein
MQTLQQIVNDIRTEQKTPCLSLESLPNAQHLFSVADVWDWLIKYKPFSVCAGNAVPLIKISSMAMAAKYFPRSIDVFREVNELEIELDSMPRINDMPDIKWATIVFLRMSIEFGRAAKVWESQDERNILSWLQEPIIYALGRRILHGPTPNIGESILAVVQHGYMPLGWRGVWPNGYAVGFCPPEYPQAKQVPPGCEPTPQQIEEGGGIPWDKRFAKPKPAPPAPIPDPPELSAVVPAAWTAFTGARWSAGAVLDHLAVMCPSRSGAARAANLADTTEGIRSQLQRLGAALTGAEVAAPTSGRGQVLRLTFARDPERSASPVPYLELPPPWTGSIAGLPLDAARVLRVHNGMRLREGTLSPEWHRFTGKHFDMEWDVWHNPEEAPPDHIFGRKRPFVPWTDGQDIVVYHPRRRRPDGQPTLHRMDHEDGELREDDLREVMAPWLDLLLLCLGLDKSHVQR